MYGCLILVRSHASLSVWILLLGSGFFYSFYPVFWSLPTMMLSESAAAAAFGLIVSVSQLGGIAGAVCDRFS